MLSAGALPNSIAPEATSTTQQDRYHQYPTRRSTSVVRQQYGLSGQAGNPSDVGATPALSHLSSNPIPKNVAFELRFEGAPNYRARLPMRVQIFPHDTTDSIVTTVKNFYGLYEGAANGVSFEDERGNTLIARYENFINNMIVYVRVISDYPHSMEAQGQVPYRSVSPQRLPQLDNAPRMLPPQPAQALSYGQPPSRPASRVSRKHSASPKLGRSQPSTFGHTVRSRSGVQNHSSSFQANLDELNNDAINGYSSSDGGAGSVTSSRKARSEQLASAEISVDNIVEGGRRKRAKFESSVCDMTRSSIFLARSANTNSLNYTGIAAFCPTTSACPKLHIFDLTATSVKWSRKCLPICSTYATYIRIQCASPVPTRL